MKDYLLTLVVVVLAFAGGFGIGYLNAQTFAFNDGWKAGYQISWKTAADQLDRRLKEIAQEQQDMKSAGVCRWAKMAANCKFGD